MDYTFTHTDFKNATKVNIEQLQKEIKISSIITTILNSAYEVFSSSSFLVTLTFNVALSSSDQSTLADIITNYIYHAYADLLVVLKDIKSPGTNGGTFTAGSWITRALNTFIGDANFITLNNNQFTIGAGKYNITAAAPASEVQNHQIKLRNITNSSDVEYGTSGFSAKNIVTNSTINTIINLNAVTVFEIQHICYETSNNIGFGKATGFSVSEVYCTVLVEKIS